MKSHPRGGKLVLLAYTCAAGRRVHAGVYLATGVWSKVNRLGAHLSPHSAASDVFPDNQLPSGHGSSLYGATARSCSIQTTHYLLVVLLYKDSFSRVCRVQPYPQATPCSVEVMYLEEVERSGGSVSLFQLF